MSRLSLYPDAQAEQLPLPQILGSPVFYRIAIGPQQGRKAFMIRTICPAVAIPRLSLSATGKVVLPESSSKRRTGLKSARSRKEKRRRLPAFLLLDVTLCKQSYQRTPILAMPWGLKYCTFWPDVLRTVPGVGFPVTL